MKNKQKANTFLYPVLSAFIIITGEILYFSPALSGNMLFGEWVDSNFCRMILEHWYEVFTGQANLLSLRAFWPCSDALGYSDLLLVPGMIYSFLRLCGFSTFTAFNPTFILLHAAGVICFYLFLRKLRLSRAISITGLFLSFWSCSFSQLALHVQFYSLALLPFFLYSTVSLIQLRKENWKKRLPYGLACVFTISLTFLSSFYIGYLFSLYVMLLLLFYLVFSAFEARSQLCSSIRFITSRRKEILAYFFLLCLLLIPLFYIYLPVYRTLGAYDTGFTIALAPTPYDYFRTFSYAPVERVLSNNLPFFIDHGYEYYASNRMLETSYGWPAIAGIIFIIIPFSLCFLKKHIPFTKRHFCLSASFALFILFLFSCRYGNFCPWLLLLHVLPGAGAIRALGRCLGIFIVPMSIVVCIFLSDISLIAFKKSSNPTILPALLLFPILLFSSQCRHYLEVDRSSIERTLLEVSAPPAECNVFFLLYGDPDAVYDPKTNMLAWQIADHFNIYTLNGYSGNYPVDWNLSAYGIDDYLRNIRNWLDCQNVSDTDGIYAYIPESGIWIRYEDILHLEN